ncbi:hypothetical protein ES695_02150 [Candidatus Atribacteria bacterium 1244-E10-H5-B2]|nr:MAG: hypothetical protein ES695_02150 [Candidatus Atribacteria bacterium 1244-E10-H5-B2]
MKKLLFLFILLTLSLSGCVFNLDNWVTPDDAEFLALIEELDTPEKIGDYMLKNFTYEIHDFYTPDPYTLWKTGKGDCNDFATFGIFIADYHDYETYQIEIFDNTLFQHYVAVYNENIWYSIADCRYYYFGFDDFREIVDYVCDIRFKTWTKYIVYDYWNDIVEQVKK